MMIIRQMKKGDLSRIKPRFDVAPPCDRSSDWSWTMEEDGVVLAIFGVAKMWGRVGHVWGMVSDDIRHKYGLSMVKYLRSLQKARMAVGDLDRLQAYVYGPNSDENSRFAVLCGLEYECTMKKAGPDGTDLHCFKIMR